MGKAVNAYVMQDEARHVMFGRLALRDYYPQLTQAERDDREEFCADACYRMRDRFLGEELWERLGYDPDACIAYVKESESQIVFRSLLFTRIVPTLKDVGLWGPKMRQTFADMGVLGYESTDLDGVMAEDEQMAEQLDTARHQIDDAVADRRSRRGLTPGSLGRLGCQTCPVPSRSAARPGGARTVGRLVPLPSWPGRARRRLLRHRGAGPSGARSGARCTPVTRSAAVPTTTTEPPLPVTPVQWTPCGDLQCGSVTVPLDYDHPDGPTLQIAVARHPAEVPSERIGSLVINPGGPGASGIDDLPDELSVLTPELLDRFDIVSFDPRGVERSSPVTCTASTGAGAGRAQPAGPPLDPVPTTAAARLALLRNDRDFAEQCERDSGAILPYRRHRRHRPGPRPDPSCPGR